MKYIIKFALILLPSLLFAAGGEKAVEREYHDWPPAPWRQTQQQAKEKSEGCESCHTQTDSHTMHLSPTVVLGCADCHGGDPAVFRPDNSEQGDENYFHAQEAAHVLPAHPERWHYPSSANPAHVYAGMNHEHPAYIRFVNPGDLRVARLACGACHLEIVEATERSLMATTAMLWGGAAYNNGILPFKRYILGEAYTPDGKAASIKAPVPPDEAMSAKGVLPQLFPLPAWEVTPPADIFRVFERGGRNITNLFPETGTPNLLPLIQRLEEPGRPDIRQSNRGPGTGNRIAVPLLNIHKTRLNDPLLWFLGTNDNPGDFRSSGCSGCHVVYANDRDPKHSGPYAKFGHWGQTQTVDPTIPQDERGHPLKHEFTRAIPSSQCMICHMHQPNMFINTYLGYTMWDYESDAPFMWPEKQHYPSYAEIREVNRRNPEGAAVRGKWRDLDFLSQVSEMNPRLNDTQFADYHGHGWNFRAIFKRDRKGNLLDDDGGIVANDDPKKFDKAVHMSSIHADVGMHCVDCHFAQDAHGNGHIYGEVAQAVEIECIDCHGSADAYPALKTSGPAAPPGGNDLSLLRTPEGKRRFEWIGDTLVQRSMVNPGMEWNVSLVKDSVTASHPDYNRKAARAKLVEENVERQDWGQQIPVTARAHQDDEITCMTCHTSWTTSCAGCHLPIEANWKSERQHFEGGETRNFATYNPQVARDQMFQIGKHGPAKGNRIAPVRSSSALVLSSTNAFRERIYVQQPPIAASGYSSQAFAPHFPHTVRKTETKQCEDCHLSESDDNNAIMAQLLLLGTNWVNFVGFNAYVGEDGGLSAVRVTEYEEPQAVIGSYLHRYAYPDWFAKHEARDRRLKEGYRHRGGPVACLQLRGEYLYAAAGKKGFRVYDVASIANKGVSHRIISAPFGPGGHDTHVKTENATCMALPTNQPIAPDRNQGELMREVNLEQPFHPMYHYAFITDAVEGLIAVNLDSLADGDPRNNFLDRALTWNQGNVLDGARHITLGGHYAYIAADAGLVIVDIDDPLAPKLVKVLAVENARASAIQFRYLFILDDSGLRIADVTLPDEAHMLDDVHVPLADPHRIYVARTYAYVAGGNEGLVIIDIENPTRPEIYQKYTAEGRLTDARDVIIGAAYASMYAYVADGNNGLKVIQMISPSTQPNFYGFSPEPKPELIAWYKTGNPAIALSRGLERDRAVDETGNQMAVFGRIGSRPFTLEEMHELYLDENGRPWKVSNAED